MKLARKLAQAKAAPSTPSVDPDARPPILVFAATPAGRMAMDALTRFNIPFVAVEFDAERFLAATADGYDMTFGDPSDVRLMTAVGVTRARALVLGQSRYEISKGDHTLHQRHLSRPSAHRRGAHAGRKSRP